MKHVLTGVVIVGGIALGLGVLMHVAAPAMLPKGQAPGENLIQLQTWLTGGGGLALLLGWAAKLIPTLNLPAGVQGTALSVTNIARIKASLVENSNDAATAAALTTAGRSAFDTLRDSTFPTTSSKP